MYDSKSRKEARSCDRGRALRWLALAVIASTCLEALPSNAQSWLDNGYRHRKRITIDSALVAGTADLNDFPLLVSFTDPSLAARANGGRVENADGFDILFANAGAAPAQLDHELQRYIAATGEIIAWVRVPTLDHDDDTDLFIYYGNGGISSSQQNVDGTWDVNHIAVLHLQESGNGSDDEFLDSSGNGHHGTGGGLAGSGDPAGTPARSAGGKIGFAQEFDDDVTSDVIRLDVFSGYASWTALTVECWIRKDDNGDDRIFTHSWGTVATDIVWNLGKFGGFAKVRMRTDTTAEIGFTAGALATGVWQHFAFTWDAADADTLRNYVGGTQTGSTTVAGANLYNSPVVAEPAIGNNDIQDRGFDGRIQECRLSNVARSAGWLNTSIANADNQGTGPGSFLKNLGAEENRRRVILVP